MEDPNWEMKEDFADLQDRMERIREIVTGKTDDEKHRVDWQTRESVFNRLATAGENFATAPTQDTMARKRSIFHAEIRAAIEELSQ
jgi:hypothetical protein